MSQNFVATYDLRSSHHNPHSAVLRQAPNHGWSVMINCTDGVPERHLPNTTLQGPFDDVPSAVAAFRRLISAAATDIGKPIEVERLAIFIWTGGRIFDLHEF